MVKEVNDKPEKSVRELYDNYSTFTTDDIKEIRDKAESSEKEIAVCEIILRERSREERKDRIFSKLQTKLLLVFTGVLAFSALITLIIEILRIAELIQ